MDSGGTVRVSFRSAAEVTDAGPDPYTLAKPPREMKVGIAADLAVVLLLSATTYSFCCPRSMREKA